MPNNTWGTAPQWKRDHAGQSGATDVQGSANTNGITHYVHVDHLGTSQRLTNAQGETTWRAVSEAFGKTFIDTTLAPATTGTTTNNLRFPGQYEDQETGTHYNWNRDYLPYAGRYAQSDPIGLDGGVNRFTYANNTPLAAVDQFGRQTYWPQNPGGNTIVCDGRGGVEVQIGTENGNLSCGLEECIRRHEEEHIRDILDTAYKKNVCRGQPKGMRVTFNTHCELYQSEVRATRVEIACVSSLLESTCPDQCRPVLVARVAQLETQLDRHIASRRKHCTGSW
jgi:RHS repeat-associated protein